MAGRYTLPDFHHHDQEIVRWTEHLAGGFFLLPAFGNTGAGNQIGLLPSSSIRHLPFQKTEKLLLPEESFAKTNENRSRSVFNEKQKGTLFAITQTECHSKDGCNSILAGRPMSLLCRMRAGTPCRTAARTLCGGLLLTAPRISPPCPPLPPRRPPLR